MLVIFFIILILLSFIFIYFDKVWIVWIAIMEKPRTQFRLKRFAKVKDYLFLTKLSFLQQDNQKTCIDMVLIANKFIYVIKNRQWLGDLNGLAVDNKWILYQGNKIIHVANPIKENEEYIEFLMKLIDAKREDFINIVVFPPTVLLSPIALDGQQEIISSRKIVKLIKKWEKSKDVERFKEEAMEKAITKISDYYIKRGDYGQV